MRGRSVLMILAVLAAPTAASASCRWIGTQLQCDIGKGHLVIGTQAAGQAAQNGSSAFHAFAGNGNLPDGDGVPPLPLEIKIQDIGADPSLCRKIGNETYCY